MVGEAIRLNEQALIHELIDLTNAMHDHPDIHLMARVLELDAEPALDQGPSTRVGPPRPPTRDSRLIPITPEELMNVVQQDNALAERGVQCSDGVDLRGAPEHPRQDELRRGNGHLKRIDPAEMGLPVDDHTTGRPDHTGTRRHRDMQ
ncbi:hypothetical protein GCM10011612_02300 [Actinomyces gaoshouyii]|uniref:Uncharacterized protein n=1 Tax=Actinomyces gaoshouyii TaxID=1960083 RepID=A0A8H9H6Q8_9ACTO|nr:hypothetical protein GCM10011612_02300 [Actinomyces gaoshouyii]